MQCQVHTCSKCGQILPLKLLVKKYFENHKNKWLREKELVKIFCCNRNTLSNVILNFVECDFIIRAKDGHNSLYKYNRGKK